MKVCYIYNGKCEVYVGVRLNRLIARSSSVPYIRSKNCRNILFRIKPSFSPQQFCLNSFEVAAELLWLFLGRWISRLRIERKIVRSLVSARNTFRIVPANYVGMYYTWQCDLNSSKGFAEEKSDKSFLSVPFDDFEPRNSQNFASAIHFSISSSFNCWHFEPLPAKVNGLLCP